MSKKALYHAEAKRLYVHEGYERTQLAEFFDGRVSIRTLDDWRIKGKWDELRIKVQQESEDLQSMIKKMAKGAVQATIDDNYEDPQKIYAACAAIGKISNKNFLEMIEAFEGKKNENESEKELTPEGAMKMMKKILLEG